MAPSYPTKSLDVLGLGGEGAGQHNADSQGLRVPVIHPTGEPKILLIICFKKVEARSGYKQIIEELLWVQLYAQGNGCERLDIRPSLEPCIYGRFSPEENRLLLGHFNSQFEDFRATLWQKLGLESSLITALGWEDAASV